MKKIIIAIILVLSFAGGSAFAQPKKNKNAKYEIEVNGNCEQCKKRIEKAAYTVSGVKSAVWDIDDHILHLIVNEEKANLTDVKKAVAAAGHDSDDAKATDKAYNGLPSCCLYKRK